MPRPSLPSAGSHGGSLWGELERGLTELPHPSSNHGHSSSSWRLYNVVGGVAVGVLPWESPAFHPTVQLGDHPSLIPMLDPSLLAAGARGEQNQTALAITPRSWGLHSVGGPCRQGKAQRQG